MRAMVIWNPKYSMYDGVLDGKVLSRCKTPQKVVDYFTKRTIACIVPDIDITSKVQPVHTFLPKSPLVGKPVRTAVRDQILADVHETIEHAKRLFGDKIRLEPKVSFFDNSARGGWANYVKHEVAFNEVLASENPLTFKNTVQHEIAHLITKQLYPWGKAHGKEFKHIFRSLGGNGSRTHNYDTSSVKQKRSYTYSVVKCSCQEHKVTPKRAETKILRCKLCHTICVPTGRTVSVTK